MLFFDDWELSGAQGCGNGEGEERVVVVSKEESGVKVSERLRLRPAMLMSWGIWFAKGWGGC